MTVISKVGAALAVAMLASSANAAINLGATTYTQNFNTLVASGSAVNNTTLPNGWAILETGGGARDNEAYAVDAGSSTTGDIYSYGSAASTDRALGSLQSGTLIPLFGASFTNSGTTAIQSLAVAYRGEQWRFGTLNRTDSLSFQYSLNATGLANESGTWTTVSGLTYTGATFASIGAKDGNVNSQAIAGSITGLNIAAGSTFWIRYVDNNPTGADDGLAVDDFNLSATFAPAAPVPEPGEWAMMLVGGGVAAAAARRRKRAKN